MKKYIKYILLFLCLIVFFLLSFFVLVNKDIMAIDNIIYNFIDKYLISDKNTPFVIVITHLGNVLFIIGVCILSLFIGKNRKVKFSIVINLVIVSVLNFVLKSIFMRPRPLFAALIKENGYSFPSGHSMIGLAFYGYFIYLICCYVKDKKIKIISASILSIVILLIGISRVYLGVHYITDVIGGFCVGIVYLILYTTITKKIIK